MSTSFTDRIFCKFKCINSRISYLAFPLPYTVVYACWNVVLKKRTCNVFSCGQMVERCHVYGF